MRSALSIALPITDGLRGAISNTDAEPVSHGERIPSRATATRVSLARPGQSIGSLKEAI